MPPVILDIGTGSLKCGFAGQQEPAVMFPTLVGRPMLQYDQGVTAGHKLADIVLGHEASAARSMLQLSQPVKQGVVTSWEDMELLFDHAFRQLGIKPAEHRIVLTEPVMNPTKNRERMFEMMFEHYKFDAVRSESQPIMALLSQGLTTGLVVDSGDGVTNVVPVWEGYIQEHCVKRLDIGGRDVTKWLLQLLTLRGYPLNSTAEFESVRELKEKLGYIAVDLQEEQRYARETTLVDTQYTLPDSRILRFGAERFLAPEILFTPALAGKELQGISELVYDSISKCPIDLRAPLFGSIIPSGGNTMFPGMIARLERDIRAITAKARQRVRVRVVDDSSQRLFNVFRGAGLLAEMQAEQYKSWVTKAKWQEEGVKALPKTL